ncbi:MAG: outer membrane beta-barrel protein [Candidatus Pseudobacter hemicellulosilyticus]|uniref:Outer membrane beta-barrel protein n=1 Tax=Candidatus Pseudobacter hemicellulosilyticus TaxID=3121375 RepID=A0AAJ5WW82_9BACT|nr:MAG: outer membrane beta-barrel protein [Pseudobacter sp.]
MKQVRLIALLLTGIAVAALAPGAVQAQQGTVKLNVNYNISSPLGDLKDFVSNTSYRGWTGSVLYSVTDKVSVGLGTGYQDFYQKYPRDNYKLSSGEDISAVVSNSLQTIPILATGQYSFSPESSIQPYVGLGIGGNLVLYRQFLGEFGSDGTKFSFAARPEAGVYIPFRKGGPAGITVNAAYNYMPFNSFGISGLNNWGGGIGVKFPLR